MDPAPMIVLFVIAAGVMWYFASAKAAARRSTLERLAVKLGGKASPSGLVGNVLGVDVTLELGSRGSGSSRTSWTFVEAVLPRGYPFAILLRKHGWFDDGKIAAGNMVDVQVGDPEFDAAFLIEAAPADVIRRLLDGEARAYLMQHRGADLGSDPIELRLAVPGWDHTEDEFLQALTFVARMSAGIRQATAALDEAVPASVSGPVFREIPDDQPLQAARAARVAEVENVHLLQQHRASRANTIGFAVIIVTGIIMLFLVAGR